MKPLHLFALVSFGAILSEPCSNAAESTASGTPTIAFATNFCDLGKLTAIEKISGSFTFTNTGDGVLKVEPPLASCDCTEPKVTRDTLQPGETAQVTYTINLDKPLTGQRFIRLRTNDPRHPSEQLTIQLEYTPLYDVSPKSFWVNVPAGKEEAQGIVTIARVDGQPLAIEKLASSDDWLSAAFAPDSKPDAAEARIIVTVRRPSRPPAPFTGKVALWMTGHTDAPVQSIKVEGEVFGEVAARPRSLYWVIPDFGKDKSAYPAESLTRTIELSSVLGHDVEITKAISDIKGLSIEVVPKRGKDAKKKFDLLLRFNELPDTFSNGKVTVETQLASLPRLEVPLTVAVPK
jgi:hypothetical protein